MAYDIILVTIYTKRLDKAVCQRINEKKTTGLPSDQAACYFLTIVNQNAKLIKKRLNMELFQFLDFLVSII